MRGWQPSPNIPSSMISEARHLSPYASVIGPVPPRFSMFKRTLAYGEYAADFFEDVRVTPAPIHYLVTREGRAEILAWGQEATEKTATQQALFAIHALITREAEVAKNARAKAKAKGKR